MTSRLSFLVMPHRVLAVPGEVREQRHRQLRGAGTRVAPCQPVGGVADEVLPLGQGVVGQVFHSP